MHNATNRDRHAAIAEGRETYTGRACLHCGGTERRTRSYECVVCHRDRANKRAAEYRKQQKYKQYQREYHMKYRLTEEGRATKLAANERWRAKKKLNKDS